MDNYEQKYNAALERAKELQKTCDSAVVVGWCEYIFPELKESEDDKIRKVLVRYFKSYKEVGTVGAETFNGIPTDNILAWLENQGKMLDPDKVIAWLVANICDFEYYVKRFKQDFGL